ncbi:MAG: hypothetical protein ACOC3Z_02540 [Nanoarchaeota archaeon]
MQSKTSLAKINTIIVCIFAQYYIEKNNNEQFKYEGIKESGKFDGFLFNLKAKDCPFKYISFSSVTNKKEDFFYMIYINKEGDYFFKEVFSKNFHKDTREILEKRFYG